MTFSVQEAE